MIELMLVGGAGAFGAALRYTTDLLVRRALDDFPWGTFIANVIGCFIVGFALPLTSDNSLSESLVITGFCGGCTTFSTNIADAFNLLKAGRSGAAFLYLSATFTVSVIALWLGAKWGMQL